uniref:Uncharacterized protein n=1 Tax=Salix viminalis TaxID=40686 RepID=A0A6N2KEZ6_SALVM
MRQKVTWRKLRLPSKRFLITLLTFSRGPLQIEISQPHQDSIMALFFKHLDHITLQDMNKKRKKENPSLKLCLETFYAGSTFAGKKFQSSFLITKILSSYILSSVLVLPCA